jgi:hypothetical protein
MEPDPVDFFGECMTSPQSGRTPLANEIYVSYILDTSTVHNAMTESTMMYGLFIKWIHSM